MIDREKKREVQLSEPDQVVAQYLQSLLSEVEEYQEQVATVSPVLVQHEVKTETQQQQGPQPVIPEWARERFQCLLFEVNGLQLGVPLCELSGIAKGDMEITHLMGQPDWHKGMIEYRGNKVGMVDISGLVMPEQENIEDKGDKLSHVLIIGDGKWGLVCDRLFSPVTLEPSEVHWSCRHENRPWLAGTLPDQLCILLDVDILLTMIRHE
ncbi:hypothetical protein MNBD_GAMMA26-766 [hydrothermal vent metagenome]|uniref:CheW-like domain-containing protein n=1 Tax=hydrothermal vent metagenome TaxID=652676 RepID=A0A3B1C1R3_9ZZZZ